MNRKGEEEFSIASKSVSWLFLGLIIAMVVLGFVYTLSDYKNKLNEVPPKLRAELIALRFTSLPECLAFQDEQTGLVSPGIIDLKRFTSENLAHCYKTETAKGYKTFNFRLKLVNAGNETFTNNYFHQESEDLTIIKEVLVRADNTLIKDQLIIYVQERI